jgi:hypothetical protein
MKPTSLTYVYVGFKLIVYACINRAGVIYLLCGLFVCQIRFLLNASYIIVSVIFE